jgi:hypothetical protein
MLPSASWKYCGADDAGGVIVGVVPVGNPPVGVVAGWADVGVVGVALGESAPAPAPKGDTPKFAYNCE